MTKPHQMQTLAVPTLQLMPQLSTPCAKGSLCCRNDILQHALNGDFANDAPLEQLCDYLEGAR